MRYWPPRSETLARRPNPARPSSLSWVLSLYLGRRPLLCHNFFIFFIIIPFHIV